MNSLLKFIPLLRSPIPINISLTYFLRNWPRSSKNLLEKEFSIRITINIQRLINYPKKTAIMLSFNESIEWKRNRKRGKEWTRKAGIGPVAQFAYSFSHIRRARYIYTRGTCSKSKFYLRTMRGKVVSRSTRLRGGYEHPKRAHVYVSTPPPSLPPFSTLVAYVVHRLKPNSTATVLKGFFFPFFFFFIRCKRTVRGTK